MWLTIDCHTPPARFQTDLHSGVRTGLAHSSATALGAMRGRKQTSMPLAAPPSDLHLPALLVIQTAQTAGANNETGAARQWATVEVKPGVPHCATRRARKH
jgi:hypothetical protein